MAAMAQSTYHILEITGHKEQRYLDTKQKIDNLSHLFFHIVFERETDQLLWALSNHLQSRWIATKLDSAFFLQSDCAGAQKDYKLPTWHIGLNNIWIFHIKAF